MKQIKRRKKRHECLNTPWKHWKCHQGRHCGTVACDTHTVHHSAWVGVSAVFLVWISVNKKPERWQMPPEVLGHCHGRPRGRSLLPSSACPRPGCYEQLGNKPVDERVLCCSAFPINKSPTFHIEMDFNSIGMKLSLAAVDLHGPAFWWEGVFELLCSCESSP